MRDRLGRHLLGSALLIAGTTIGAAMLALPIDTGLMGFLPATALFVCIWLALMATAFYFMEVALRSPRGTNMITMAGLTLGKPGKWICIFFYVLLLYALVCSYLSGGASALHVAAARLGGFDLTFPQSVILFSLFFGSFIYLGTSSVDFINRLFFFGLFCTFLMMLALGFGHVEGKKLLFCDLGQMRSGIAVAVTSFGFHIVIPTIRDYLGGSVKAMRRALWVGGSIPLVVYTLWNATLLGMLPLSDLEGARRAAEMPQVLIERSIGANGIALIASGFAYFAIVTSFLGVSMSLVDFIADGLKIKRGKAGQLALCALVFIPPSLFVLRYPTGFYGALRFGGVMVTVLLGLFPPLMVFSQRMRDQKGEIRGYRVPGGLGLLFAVFLFFVLVLSFTLQLALS